MSAQESLQLRNEKTQAVDVIPAQIKDSNPPQHRVARLVELTRQIMQQVNELMLINTPATARIERLSSEGVDFYKEVEKFEVQLITCTLQRTQGNQRQAAKFLGLKPTTLHSKIKQYSITSACFDPSTAGE
ncbi:MAG TPA: helix-turn-helix domain-containing protein [Pyrinomonadaceae bacterium]|jgi:DNA-binding NtrC family response regulator